MNTSKTDIAFRRLGLWTVISVFFLILEVIVLSFSYTGIDKSVSLNR